MPSVGCIALVPTPAMSSLTAFGYVELAPFSYILLYIQSSERQNYKEKSGLRAGLVFSGGVVLYTNTKVLEYAKF
jgi:hypothetical protein